MEIHRADKAYRTRSLWLLAVIVLMCAALLWQLNAWLQQLAGELGSQDPDVVRRWVRILFASLGVGLAIPAAGLGITLRQLAHASRLQGRFPPREWKTLRDVRVLRDAAALAWARRVEVGGTAAIVLSAALIVWAAWAWWRFG